MILHVDLLNTYNTIRKIWSFEQENDVEKEDDVVFFDRIALNKEGFCLWKDDGKWADYRINKPKQNTPAMSIRFCLDWMNILENQTLFETFYKNHDPENKNKIMLYEGILNKKNDEEEKLLKTQIPSNTNDVQSILNQSNVKKTDTKPKKNIFYNKLKIVSFLLLSGLLIVFSLCKKLKSIKFFH